MPDDNTEWIAEAAHLDFDQSVTSIVTVIAACVCLQDTLLKVLNTTILFVCCNNDTFSCSSKLWKLMIALTQTFIAVNLLYCLYEFNFDTDHTGKNVTVKNTGYDYAFVCKKDNIVDYVNTLNTIDVKYENLLLLWSIPALVNLNYFLEGGLQCSIDNAEAPVEKQTKKPKMFAIFAVLYGMAQIILMTFLFPAFCYTPSHLKWCFLADAVITFFVLAVYFKSVPRVSHFDFKCDWCRVKNRLRPSLFGSRALFVIFCQLGLILYAYFVTWDFDTIVGILLWLSSVSVRVLIYFVTPEHEITQWFMECCAGRDFSRQNRQDGMGSMGSGIELTMPSAPTGAFQPVQLPSSRGGHVSIPQYED